MKFVNCMFCTQSQCMCYFVAVTTLSPSSVLSTTSSQDTSAISNSIITTNTSTATTIAITSPSSSVMISMSDDKTSNFIVYR